MDSFERILHTPNEKLSVLATGADAMLDVSVHAQQYEELVDFVMQSWPIVIVDLSDAIPSLKRTVLNKAHEIVLVTMPTLTSLRATRTLMNEIKSLHGGNDNHIDLVVNMSGMVAGKEVGAKDIETVLERKPSAQVPFNAKLFIGCENEGRSLTDDKGGVDIVEKLIPFAQKVISVTKKEEVPEKKDGFLQSILSLGKKGG
jgi:pilus assembly protein CpaE